MFSRLSRSFVSISGPKASSPSPSTSCPFQTNKSSPDSTSTSVSVKPTEASSSSSSSSVLPLRPFSLIPGPRCFPVLGGSLSLISLLTKSAFINTGGISAVYKHWYKLYGRIFKYEGAMGTDKRVFVTHPDDVMKVYFSEGKYPSGATSSVWVVRELAGHRPLATSLLSGLVSVGPSWRSSRTALNKHLFSHQDANSYIPLLDAETKIISETIFRQINKTHNNNVNKNDNTNDNCQGIQLPLAAAFRFIAFDLFCSAMIGKSFNTFSSLYDNTTATTNNNEQHPDYTTRAVALRFISSSVVLFRQMGDFLYSPLPPSVQMKTKAWREYVKVAQEVDNIGLELVSESLSLASIANSNSSSFSSSESPSPSSLPSSYLSRLLSDGTLSSSEAGALLASLLSAAVDTTSTALSRFVYAIARHTDKQQKLRAELDRVLKGGAYCDSLKSSLPYLSACWRESQRLYPVGAVTTPRILQQPIEIQGYEIPSGTTVQICSHLFQMDETYFKDPTVYLPERWLSSSSTSSSPLHSHKILGLHSMFSFGPRMCLGARLAVNEILTLIVRLVQDFDITVQQGHQHETMRLLLEYKPDPILTFTPRTKSS